MSDTADTAATADKAVIDKCKIYRALVAALRHNHNFKKSEMGSDGFVLLSVIHRVLPSTAKISIPDLLEIVENCSKQRCAMIVREGNWMIRANQGHSADVADKSKLDQTEMCERITEPRPCFHGTFQKSLPEIKCIGLSRMKRQHIHLATAIDAKSGARKNCDVHIYIDMAQAMADGIQFYMSANGVILTEGADGILAPKYFSRINIL